MSSATSTDAGKAGAPPAADDPGLHPWQFFLLAGMLSATVVVLMVTGQSPASIIVLSLTVVAASLVALGTYRALVPLAVPDRIEAPPLIVGRTRAALEREKTLALRSIKELEFDFAMKKVAKADFDELSARLRTRAMGLLAQLDQGGYRDAIDREVHQRLGARVQEFTGATGARAMGATGATGATGLPRRSAEGAKSGECACGTVNDADARFCKNCGSKLDAA